MWELFTYPQQLKSPSEILCCRLKSGKVPTDFAHISGKLFIYKLHSNGERFMQRNDSFYSLCVKINYRDVFEKYAGLFGALLLQTSYLTSISFNVYLRLEWLFIQPSENFKENSQNYYIISLIIDRFVFCCTTLFDRTKL